MKNIARYTLATCSVLLISGLAYADDPKFTATDTAAGTPATATSATATPKKEAARSFAPTQTAYMDISRIVPECAQAQTEGAKLQREFEAERGKIEKLHRAIDEKAKKNEVTQAEYTKEMNNLQVDAKALQEEFAGKFRALDDSLKESVEAAAEKIAKKYNLISINPKGVYTKEEFLVDDEIVDAMNKTYYEEKRKAERDAKFKKAEAASAATEKSTEKPAAKPAKKKAA
jgi:Skp family chaperone for outer membrane proteins